jgi:hypothetical protein
VHRSLDQINHRLKYSSCAMFLPLVLLPCSLRSSTKIPPIPEPYSRTGYAPALRSRWLFLHRAERKKCAIPYACDCAVYGEIFPCKDCFHTTPTPVPEASRSSPSNPNTTQLSPIGQARRGTCDQRPQGKLYGCEGEVIATSSYRG